MIYVMFHVAMILFDRFIVIGSAAVFFGVYYRCYLLVIYFAIQEGCFFIIANDASFKQMQRHIMP